MLERITLSRSEMEKFSGTVEKWTTETLLERKLFSDGFAAWEESINLLRTSSCLKEKDEESIAHAMEKAYIANEKLVTAQELTDHVCKERRS